MGWVATAIIGSAVIGGVASNSAAKKAAKGQENALEASSAATAQARGDIKGLFGEADTQQGQAFQDTRNFLTGALPAQIAPFQAGNVAAQEQLARGLPQIQNALMGNPVDLSGFQARRFDVPQLPGTQAGGQPQQQQQPPVATGSPLGGGGMPSGVNVNPPGIGDPGAPGIGGLGIPSGGFFGGGMPSNNIFGAGIPSRNIFGGIQQQPVDAFIQNDQRLF